MKLTSLKLNLLVHYVKCRYVWCNKLSIKIWTTWSFQSAPITWFKG